MALTPKHEIATVGELEKLIRQLKRDGQITSSTRLSGVDVDGGTSGKGPCSVYVFGLLPEHKCDHQLAIWGGND